MNRDSLPIIDVDTHHAENLTGLWKFMDEPWRSRLKERRIFYYLPQPMGDRHVEERIDRSSRIPDTADMDTSEVQAEILATMERMGVQACLLVPNRLAVLGHLSVRDAAQVIANAHIDDHLTNVADAAKGIYTMPCVTWHDPEASAELIHRVGDDPAVAAVCLLSSFANPPWGDVTYNPIFEAALAHDLPIVLHASSGMTGIEGATFADGLQRTIESHSLNFLFSNQLNLTSMIYQGVPVRYPDLKIVFLETGVLWVPAMMYRLDAYYLKRRSEAPLLSDLPSEYIRRHFYFGTQPIEEPRSRQTIEAAFDAADGRNRFMFASDVPHWDYDEPVTISKLGFLSREDQARVFAGNALEVFNFAKGGGHSWIDTVSARLRSSAQLVE